MKRIIINIISFILLLAILSVNINAEESFGWFLSKRDNQPPKFPTDASFIREHGGYYIDDNACESDKVLYLTFDAGYENGNVEKILNIMKKEDVKGAFFLLSNIIIKNPELIKRMSSEGHIICNHTKNHKDISTLTDSQIEANLKYLEDLCLEKTGCSMKKYFRYPEGKYSKRTLLLLEKLGYKTFFWSMAYADWDNSHQPSKEKAIDSLLKQTHNGAIILLHPTSSTNVLILEQLIKSWKAEGYRFATLDELIK